MLKMMNISYSHCEHDLENQLKRSLSVLRDGNLKITKPRRVILSTLIQEHGPFTMEEIHQRIRREACDLVTVYRCLATLEKVGLVRRCDFGDGSSRYEFSCCDSHHHHHIICKKCRKVETLDTCLVETLEKSVREMGYTKVSHSLEFFGICVSCQKSIV